jgi:lysozyme family protein
MSYAFSALAPEYDNLLSHMVIDAGKLAAFESTAHRIIALAKNHGDEWAAVHAATGVNIGWGICSFERESSSDYRTNPAQGDPWNHASTHVPRGRGPFANWGAACIDAYHIDHLETVGAAGWTWARDCYEGELFNGFGPRMHGRHSGYLWAGTNIYTGGKYDYDSHWNPGAWDTQLGMIPLLFTVARLAPEYAPIGTLSDLHPNPAPPAPAPVPDGLHVSPHGVAWMQAKLGVPADGNFGRHTKRALVAFQKAHGLTPDGLFGPATDRVMSGLS